MNRTAWVWSIGLVLFIGLTPLAAAFLGELIAILMDCEIDFPNLGECSRSNDFFRSFSIWLMAMIRWAIITVPSAIVTLIGLFVTYSIMKKRDENA